MSDRGESEGLEGLPVARKEGMRPLKVPFLSLSSPSPPRATLLKSELVRSKSPASPRLQAFPSDSNTEKSVEDVDDSLLLWEMLPLAILQVKSSTGAVERQNLAAQQLLGTIFSLTAILPLEVLRASATPSNQSGSIRGETLDGPIVHHITAEGRALHVTIQVLHSSSSTTTFAIHNQTVLAAAIERDKQSYKQKNILDSLTCCTAIFSAKGETMEVNRAALSFFGGLSLDEAKCTNISDLFEVREDWTQESHIEVHSKERVGIPRLVSLDIFTCSPQDTPPHLSREETTNRMYMIIFKDMEGSRSQLLDLQDKLLTQKEQLRQSAMQDVLQKSWNSLFIASDASSRANLDMISDLCLSMERVILKEGPEAGLSILAEIKMIKKSSLNLGIFQKDLCEVMDLESRCELAPVDAGKFLFSAMKIFKHSCFQQMQEIQVNHFIPDEVRLIITYPPYLRQIIHLLLLNVYNKNRNNNILILIS